jgi:hypothetical protein
MTRSRIHFDGNVMTNGSTYRIIGISFIGVVAEPTHNENLRQDVNVTDSGYNEQRRWGVYESCGLCAFEWQSSLGRDAVEHVLTR